MQKSAYVKIHGCLARPKSRAHENSAMEDSWVRIDHIAEVCPFVGLDRIRESITKEEYDARPNDDFYSSNVEGVVTLYWKYFTSCRILFSVLTERSDITYEVRESAESLMARINAAEFPPEEPEPTTLGYAFEAMNTQTVVVTVDDLDDFDTIRFAGKASATLTSALSMADNVASEVAPGDIGVGTNPLSAESHVIDVGGVGNIKVSRSQDGTVLYFVADDAVQAFGIQITAV